MRQKKVKTCWCCATDDRSNQQQQILTALSRSFFLDNFNVQCRHRHKDALRAPLQKKLLPLGSRSSALRRRAFFFLFNSLRTASSAWRVDMLQRCQDFNSDCRLIKKKRQREKEEVKMAGRWIEYLHAHIKAARGRITIRVPSVILFLLQAVRHSAHSNIIWKQKNLWVQSSATASSPASRSPLYSWRLSLFVSFSGQKKKEKNVWRNRECSFYTVLYIHFLRIVVFSLLHSPLDLFLWL